MPREEKNANGYRADDDLNEYIHQSEPLRKEKGRIWQTAIGLQAVDGLRPSEYLFQTAKENIDGNITFKDVKDRLDSYYGSRPAADDRDRTEEADKVSARIAEILSEKTMSFSVDGYIAVHKRLFTGIYEFAGMLRNYNITKSEWVLNGKTVLYADAGMIRAALDHDLEHEKRKGYEGLTEKQTAERIAKFVSDIWQVHAFGEGNTRTTAVFAIKYLRSLGLDIENDQFRQHSWYFRNALVRANYNDLKNNVHATQRYLDRFFGNLLLGERNVLRNRELHVDWKEGTFLIGGYNSSVAGYKSDRIPSGYDILNDTLNDTLNFIADNPKATQDGIAKNIGKSTATVKRATAELVKRGMIERVNGKRDGYWMLR